jgi:hypothetical protein
VWRARAFGASRKRFCVHLRAKARERLHTLVTHGLMLGFQIAPTPRMAGRAAPRFAADVGGEEKYHIRVSAGAERYGDERGAAMDLRHDGRGDQFAFSREGASVFEALEPVPELKRLRRALAHCPHAADPGRLARHEAEMTDDRNLLIRERPTVSAPRLVSTASAPPVIAAKAVRRISSAVTASAKPSAAVTKTRCEPRARARY